MKLIARLLLLTLLAIMPGCRTPAPSPEKVASARWLASWRAGNPVWRGVHLSVESDAQADALIGQLPQLAALGVNVIVTEVDYGFEFQSHPELRSGRFLSRDHARKLARA